MKFLSRLDPMTVLLLVVIFGVVITMSAQVASQPPASKATTAQVIPADPADQAAAKNHPGES
ncbi:MAG TPA: hypothetical protein ENK04_01985 [Gammaproteobacteria bacterium]|nr:hypothetical protein [Gammaproteobacteria bacterium]